MPGSGKSKYLENLRVNAISSDALRILLGDDVNTQAINAQVFATMRYLLRRRICAGRPVSYVDATHLTPDERAPYVRIARAFRCEIEALYFDTPIEICRSRNRERERVVPEEAMTLMQSKLVPPRLEEGFSRITVVRDRT